MTTCSQKDNDKNNRPACQTPSLAENFNQYFKIKVASTSNLRQEAFKIRHKVYSEELGWEDTNAEKIETDEYDDYSFHCLLEHRATKSFAGCIRVVIPSPQDLTTVTPFEEHCLTSVKPDVLDMSQYSRGSFGEISRLAVPDTFRRRRNEKNQPFIINGGGSRYFITAQERRHFPNIAVGLYFSILSLVNLCRHDAIFVMMEPRLQRQLTRFGLPFIQAGELIDYHGDRALFYLPLENLSLNLNPELEELRVDISDQVKQQIKLWPYIDLSDR